MWCASSKCLSLLMHEIRAAFSFAPAKAGKSSAARMAIMAITTSSSIKVKALDAKGLAISQDCRPLAVVSSFLNGKFQSVMQNLATAGFASTLSLGKIRLDAQGVLV